MSLIDTLDFKDCFDALRRSHLPFTPSEAHAIAVGMISGNVSDRDAVWVTDLYADLDENDALATEARTQLDTLYLAAQEQMADDEFGLQLLMPDGLVEGYNVAMALRDWAQGFLYGFGLAGKGCAERLSDEGKEALRDFYEISKLDAELGDLAEEDLQAQSEVEEYVRVAAMLIHEDVRSQTPPAETHELH